MSFKVSTGLRNAMLATDSFKDAMDGCFLLLYSGTVPSTADESIGAAVLQVIISVDAGITGLTFESAAVAGILSKTAAENWQGVVGPGGEITFFRLAHTADFPGLLDPTALRVQGDVGVVGAELNLSSVNVTGGSTQTINHFNVALPTL